MNILINTRLLLSDKLEGIGWFTHELLSRIVKIHPEHTFYFLFDRNYDKKFIYSENVIPLVYGPPARHPFLYLLWFEFVIPKVIKRYKIDLFFSPDHFLSLRAKVPSLLAIHDLNFIHNPENLPFFEALYYKYFVPKYIKKANGLVCVSEYTKNDVINNFNVDSKKIDVVYNAPNIKGKILTEAEKNEVRKKYTGGFPFFIYLGSLHRRKNTDRILKAFDLFAEETKGAVYMLFVGKPMWKDKIIDEAYNKLKHKDKVIFTGYLKSDEVAKILASSLALVFVSLFEGFGVPLVEAMSLGIPVITSNVTAMPEIAKDAAIFVNPKSVEEIKNAMIVLYKDENLRNSLIQKGLQRSLEFSWDLSAEKLWEAIVKIMKN
jgi:glycosyltransferase involved in cell wall biosynthesis